MAAGWSEAAHKSTGWSNFLAEGRFPRFALICLGIWLNAADSLVTATLMPSIGAEIGGYAYFGWATAGFLLGAVLAGASAGRMSEIVGLRLATTFAGLLLAAGCAMSALAPNISLFLAGRVVQGIGGGWISGLGMVAIALLFPERHLARMFASISAVWGIATVLGPLIGGSFAQTGAWRTVFWVFALQALLFAAAAPALLRQTSPRRGAGVPWRQLIILAFGVGAIALADVTPSALLAFAMILVGLALVSLVLAIDARAQVRLLPQGAGDPRRSPGAGYAALFCFVASSMGLLVYAPTFLQVLHGLTPLWAGYIVAAQALSWTLSSFVVVSASEASQRRWIRVGAIFIFASLLLLMVVMAHGALTAIVASVALMGVGFGLSVSLINRRVIRVLPDAERAVGGSALMAARQTGGAVGAAIAGATANVAGFGTGLSEAGVQNTAFFVFATALPLAVGGVCAAWRLTGAGAEARQEGCVLLAPRHPLLLSIEALSLRERQELACAVSMLWDEFETNEVPTTEAERRAYVVKMRAAADRVRKQARADRYHLALAPDLMALYGEVADASDPSPDARRIAEHLPIVVAHGHAIRRSAAHSRTAGRSRDAAVS